MNKLIGVILALVLPLQAEAASPFDPSSRYSSRAEYCSDVKNLVPGLYANVEAIAGSFKTTFADVISHNVGGVLSLIINNYVDAVDAAGVLVLLSSWDTGKARQRAADEELNRRFSEMIGRYCNSDTLRLAARGYR